MKETRILICLIIIALSPIFMAFDLGLRIDDQPNPAPIAMWDAGYINNVVNGSVEPINYLGGIIVLDPQPLGLIDSFRLCFDNPVVEPPPNPVDAWIFQPGAYGTLDKWSTDRLFPLVP